MGKVIQFPSNPETALRREALSLLSVLIPAEDGCTLTEEQRLAIIDDELRPTEAEGRREDAWAREELARDAVKTLPGFWEIVAAKRAAGELPPPLSNDPDPITTLGRDLLAAERSKRLEPEYRRMAEVAKGHWTGGKYQRGRDLREVAKDIRTDIAAAVKSGALPKGIKCRVRISRFAGGQSLTINVVEVPASLCVVNIKRVRQDHDPNLRHQPSTMLASLRSEAGQDILDAIEKLANVYNYDKSDGMTDYFDTAFYLSVGYGDLECTQRDEARAAIVAAYKVCP